jgi:hypothetical protein
MEIAPIHFQEVQSDASDLMQELGSPDARRNVRVPFPVAVELRRNQIRRLQENISILRRKREEFNRRMEDYIDSLEHLIANLRRGVETQEQHDAVAPHEGDEIGGTVVRCVGCGGEKEFPNVNVLIAVEPDNYLAQPTEVIIECSGELKKGYFKCPKCGEFNLTIRPRGGEV